MNGTIAKKAFGQRWRSTIVYSGSLAAYVLMSNALYPTAKKFMNLSEVYKKAPKGLLRFFGMESADIASYSNYMTGRIYGLIWIVVGCAFVMAFARAMVSGELEEGTLEILLAQPVERWRILVEEGLVLLLGIIFLVSISLVCAVASAPPFGIHVSIKGHLALALLGIAIFSAIGGYSLFFSVVFNDSRHCLLAASGLTFAFYMVHFASFYWKPADWIDRISIFHYYDPARVLAGKGIPWGNIFALFLFAVIFFLLAVWLFERKDIYA